MRGTMMDFALTLRMISARPSSTLLSLLVVPCMYSYFDDLQGMIGRVWRWRPGRRSTPEPPIAVAGEPELPKVGDRAAASRRGQPELGAAAGVDAPSDQETSARRATQSL